MVIAALGKGINHAQLTAGSWPASRQHVISTPWHPAEATAPAIQLQQETMKRRIDAILDLVTAVGV